MRAVVALLTGCLTALALLLPGAGTAAAGSSSYRVVDSLQMPNQTGDVVADPDRGILYVMVPNAHLIRMIDADTLTTIADVPIGEGARVARQMALDPVSGLLVVTVSRVGVADPESRVEMVDPDAAAVVASVVVGSQPYGVTVSAASRIAYIGSPSGLAALTLIDLTDPLAPTVSGTIPLPSSAERVVESPDGALLYAVGGSAVWVLDPATGDVRATWSGFRSAHQVAFSTSGERAFVTQQLGAGAAVIDVATGTQVATVDLTNTYYMADDGDGTVLMTAPFLAGGTVGLVDAGTGELTGTLAVPSAYRVAVDGTRGLAVVSSIDSSGVVSVLRAVRAPRVVDQPADVTVTVGEPAAFTATATGSDTTGWQRSDDDGTTWIDLPGETGTVLTLPVTEAGDAGSRFRAVFTNDVGSVVSGSATLTVLPAVPDPVVPDPVVPDPVVPDPSEPDPVVPDPADPDPVVPDAVDPGAVDPDVVDPGTVDPVVVPDAAPTTPSNQILAPSPAHPTTTAPEHAGILAITGVPAVAALVLAVGLSLTGGLVLVARRRRS
jgi:hypothetical protein